MPADRRAFAAVVLPGCRTRAAAERACAEMDDSFFAESERDEGRPSDEILAFLETAAPASFRTAIRARLGGPHRERALYILVTIGDPASGEILVAEFGDDPERLAQSRCAAVIAHLTAACRADGKDQPWEPLIHALGAPRELRWVFLGEVPPRSRERLFAGDWRGAVLAVLEEQPDIEHGDIGALRGEPAVEAYLRRLRARRDLGLYWYATGQLAAYGDPAARAEFWQAMTDGRYRIIDESEEFARTLGLDFAATMPHWIRELRSNCCRACNGVGDPWEDFFDIDGYETWQRTPADRAQSIWDASGGRFAWSWVVDEYVIAAD
jgi:hypothetical protein